MADTHVRVTEGAHTTASVIEQPFRVIVDEGQPNNVYVTLPTSFQNYVVHLDDGKHIYARVTQPDGPEVTLGDIWFVLT